MHKFGRYAVIAGILLIALGMIIGFIILFQGGESAIIWLGSVIPIGFVILLTGMVTTQLSNRESDED